MAPGSRHVRVAQEAIAIVDDVRHNVRHELYCLRLQGGGHERCHYRERKQVTRHFVTARVSLKEEETEEEEEKEEEKEEETKQKLANLVNGYLKSRPW